MVTVTHPLTHPTRSHNIHTLEHWIGLGEDGSTEPPWSTMKVANPHEVAFTERTPVTSVATGFRELLADDSVFHGRPDEVQLCSEAPPLQQNTGGPWLLGAHFARFERS
ncbi:hypothetical protein MTO96_006315 [Rhipicephalus appendiculatus]